MTIKTWIDRHIATKASKEACMLSEIDELRAENERLTAGDVALPKTQWLGDIHGFTITQLKDYGYRHAADAVLINQERLEELLSSVDRVLHKYGCDNTGEPLDWTEWKNVRIALSELRKGTL